MARMKVGLVVLAASVLFPVGAWAQSAIAGVVKDTSGAVLPGVTVEAASHALIEKVRAVTTDTQGQYKIVDLRPGLYSVTFTMPGFATAQRDGVELATNFTAAISMDMQVGSLTETVTVSGLSPIVDVQNVNQGRTVNQETIAAVPSSRTFQQLAGFIPGIIVRTNMSSSAQDVGGTAGDKSSMVQIHGGRPGDMQMKVDGMLVNNVNQVAQSGIFVDMGSLQEVAYQVGAMSAENQTGGVQANFILKDGSNRHTASFFAAGTNASLQRNNITQKLIDRGINAPNQLDKLWDLNGSYIGPLISDKLWLVVSTRYWGLNNRVLGIYENLTPDRFVYTPDVAGGVALDDTWLRSATGRLTWQMNPKNKVSIHYINTNRCFCHQGLSNGNTAPEASTVNRNPTDYDASVVWTAQVTNRLLLEAGLSYNRANQNSYPQREVAAANRLGVTELSTGFLYRSVSSGGFRLDTTHNDYRASASYVTGSHAIKTGFYLQEGEVSQTTYTPPGGPLALALLNGQPNRITYLATPFQNRNKLNANLGIFVQDQWTLSHLTITAGLRFDYQNESVPAQHLDATQWLPARDYPELKDVVNWKDLSPRLGASYDVFGNGKTAIKASVSRYVKGEGLSIAQSMNPAANTSATRPWSSNSGLFNPYLDCDLYNYNAQVTPTGGCGAISNRAFGLGVNPTNYDPDVVDGWQKRGNNWETSATIQHELRPGLSVTAAYFHRSYFNNLATVNTLADPSVASNYTSYCITVPVDPRLPGGGGNQICGLKDVIPALFGQVNNRVTFAKNLGADYERHNSIDFSMNMRLPHGAQLQGGVSTTKWSFDNCDVIGKANSAATAVDPFVRDFFTVAGPNTTYCHQESPFQPTLKFVGSIPLKWGLQASGSLQSVPGVPISASYTMTNAQIAPFLGRNLAAGVGGTVAVQLVPPSQYLDDRVNQADVRLSKILKWGQRRIQGNFDLYNLFNRSPVLVPNNTYGANWSKPQLILPGRLFKTSVQFDF